MVYDKAWGGIAYGTWYGLMGMECLMVWSYGNTMVSGMVWPGGHGVVYDMVWRAKHGIWYGLAGIA